MKRALSFSLSLLLIAAVLFIPAGVRAQEDTEAFNVFITEDGAFGVFLPEGWAADGSREGGLTIANSQEALDALLSDETEGGPESGQVGILVLTLDRETQELLGIAEDASFVDALNTVVALILEDESEEEVPVMTEVTEFDFNGKPAASAEGTTSDVHVLFLAYEIAPDTLAVAYLVTAPGELDAVRENGINMIDNVGYSLPLDETFTSETAGISFSYPAGWLAEESGPVVIVSNSEEAMAADELGEDQYGLIVINPANIGITSTDLTEVAAALADQLKEETDEVVGPIILMVGEQEIVGMAASNPDGNGDGGVFVTNTPKGIMAVAYAGSTGQAALIGFSALQVLLSIE